MPGVVDGSPVLSSFATPQDFTTPTTSERYSGYLLGHFRPWLMQLGQENTPGNIPRETTEELFQELGSLGLQSGEVIRHKGSLSVAQLLYTYRDAQNHVIKKETR